MTSRSPGAVYHRRLHDTSGKWCIKSRAWARIEITSFCLRGNHQTHHIRVEHHPRGRGWNSLFRLGLNPRPPVHQTTTNRATDYIISIAQEQKVLGEKSSRWLRIVSAGISLLRPYIPSGIKGPKSRGRDDG
jgi:hypothetical protein